MTVESSSSELNGWPFWGMVIDGDSHEGDALYTKRYLDLGSGDPFSGLKLAGAYCFMTLREYPLAEIVFWIENLQPAVSKSQENYKREWIDGYMEFLRSSEADELQFLPDQFGEADVWNLLTRWHSLLPGEPNPALSRKDPPPSINIRAAWSKEDSLFALKGGCILASALTLVEICRLAREFQLSKRLESDLVRYGRHLTDIQATVLDVRVKDSLLNMRMEMDRHRSGEIEIKQAVQKILGERARRSSDVRHATHRAYKQKVFAWMDCEAQKYPSLEHCVNVLLAENIVSMARATLRGWLTDWNKQAGLFNTSRVRPTSALLGELSPS